MIDVSKYFELKRAGDVTIIMLSSPRLSEEGYVNNLRAMITVIIERTPVSKLVINFGCVDFLSSLAIAKLVVLKTRAEEQGVKLKFSDMKPHIGEIFEITRLNTLFDIYKTEGEAIIAFERS
jgi:anti-sigma B factor antagonist